MKLSKRGEYGLRALIDLALAAELGRDLVQLNELAEGEKIPIKFLEQIVLDLKEGGFLASVRGKHGGYKLSRPANQIAIGQIVRHLDGPLAPIGCVSLTAYQRCSCPDEDHCGLRMLMLDVRNAIANILDRYTLANVVEVTLRKMRNSRIEPPFATKAVRAADTPKRSRRSMAALAGKTGGPASERGLEEFFYREGI